MHPENILKILEKVQEGGLSAAEALDHLRDLPFRDIGIARLDEHRELRTGVPEIVFGEGKSTEQLSTIVRRMTEKGSLILVSRLDESKAAALLQEFPKGVHHREARIFSLGVREKGPTHGRVKVLAAGTSDIAVAEEAAVTVSLLGNDVDRIYDIGIAGLPRLLSEIPRIREASVLIIIAGMEGALPSLVAGLVGRPIIAVPTSVGYGTGLGGISALLTMLNSCAPGVTVVNIDNGIGAAVAAHLMNRQESTF